MHPMLNLGNLLARLATLRQQYEDCKRAGAKAEQTTQIVTQLITLLVQAVQTPLAKEVGSALHEMVQNTSSQVTRDPYFTTAIAEYLRTRIKVLDDAATRFADAFHEAGNTTQFGPPGPAVLIPTTVLDQVPVLLDILYRTAYECESFSLLIPSSQSVLASQLLFESEKEDHATAPTVLATTTGTASPTVPSPFPTVPNLPIPIKRRIFLTQGAKARHLLVKVMWFCRWLRAALRQRRTTLDQAGNFGLYDPVALSHVASVLLMDTAKARTYCNQLSKDASTLLGYA